MKKIKITLWNEFVHERTHPEVARIYPEGIHAVLAKVFESAGGFDIRTATLDQPEHGLEHAVLNDTDVLTWWGHAAHDQVSDAVIARVHQRVLDGMGLIVLHSGHWSKLFKRIMGTSCALRWREAGERERIWVVDPGHPIADGVDDPIELEQSEMYGEPFGIPTPDDIVFISWFQGGEVFFAEDAVASRKRAGLLFQPRSRVLSHLSSSANPEGDHKCRSLGSSAGSAGGYPSNTPIEKARENLYCEGPVFMTLREDLRAECDETKSISREYVSDCI